MVCQVESLKNGKGAYVAKQLVLSKIEGQSMILKKHGLEAHDSRVKYEVERMEAEDLSSLRYRLTAVEAKYFRRYFSQVFELFSEKLRPSRRQTFLAYDGVNNTFNLAYEVLKWKVHMAIVRANLEPFLGFLHSLQFSKPSLTCDMMELYRYLIDDFLIQYCQNLRVKDFRVKTERLSRNKKGKREYLNDPKTSDLMKKVNVYFESKVQIPRIKHGNRQTIETLINEEALLFAKFLRGERGTWVPRIPSLWFCVCVLVMCIIRDSSRKRIRMRERIKI